jgi:hypothetical protein
VCGQAYSVFAQARFSSCSNIPENRKMCRNKNRAELPGSAYFHAEMVRCQGGWKHFRNMRTHDVKNVSRFTLLITSKTVSLVCFVPLCNTFNEE